MAFLHLIGPLLGLLLLSGSAWAKGAAASGQSQTHIGGLVRTVPASAEPNRSWALGWQDQSEILARASKARGEWPALLTSAGKKELDSLARASQARSKRSADFASTSSEGLEAPAPASRAPAPALRHRSRSAGPPRRTKRGTHPDSRLARWLSRPVSPHPEFLNHGEISPFVDIGLPFGYRLGFKIGLLDVLTVGLIAQWRNPSLGLRIAPELGLALYRGRHLALGLRYRYLFHPLPAPPLGPEEQFDEKEKQKEQGPDATPSTPPGSSAEPSVLALPEPRFFPRTHYVAASMVWSSGYLSAGMEAGLSYRRELDQSQEILDPNLFRMQWRPMTGVLLRFGDPQWGVVLQAMIPSPELSLRFEWRYSLFAQQKSREPLSWALQRARQRQRALKAARSGAR